MSLEQALEKWSQSSAGKSRLKSAVRTAPATSNIAKAQVKAAEFYSKEFRRILNEVMVNTLGYSYESYLQESAAKEPEENAVSIKMTFDPEKIHRDSLQPDRYDGAYDIVALLNHGYSADGAVYGYYKPADKVIRSLVAREGTFFIQRAVEQFNSLYGKSAKAYYNEKYDKRN